MLGLDRNKEYKKYDHFKQRVLLIAQKEIKEKAGLLFNFEEIRRGKPVYQIRFYNIHDSQDFELDSEPLQLSFFGYDNENYLQNKIKSDKEVERFMEKILPESKKYY
jgi:plasmid replication initiation protein